MSEALERRLLLATLVGSRWAPDSLDEAITFRLPLSSDTTTHFYFDRDPAAGVDRAWNGSTTAVYDGHTGTDFSGGPRGRPVYAAADGILVARVDGFGDQEGTANGNYIKLNHGNDRSGNPINTFYLHLNVGTPINLPLGTFIAAGTQVGGVGTSGNSTGLHLHFHLSRNGVAIDPFAAAGESSWWTNQGSGSPSTATPAPKFQVGQYVEVHSLAAADSLNIRSPDPTSAAIGTQSNGAIGRVLEGPALSYTGGDYNGNVYTRYKVQFNNGMTGWAAQNWLKLAPPQEITVAQGATAVTDAQAGAVSFGSVEKRQPGPTRAFTVTNSGNQTLTLGAPSVPSGFTLIEGLSSSLAPGASDTFTVRLDSATVGAKSGSISFSNNDGNENPFNFPISGTVTADVTAPTADVVDIAPDPRNSPLSSMTIVFSEPVLNFDKADLLLTRNGGTIELTAAQTLTSSDNITFTLSNLAPVTGASGTYTLSVLAGGVTDDSSNALASGASDTVKVQTPLFRGDAAGSVADAYYLRRSVGGGNVEIFENAPPTGAPTYVLPWAGLTTLTFETGSGGDTLTIDYTNGDPVPAGASGFSYTATGAKSLALTGPGTFTLRDDMTLATLDLLAGAQLNLSTHDLLVTTGDIGAWNGSAYTGLTGLIALGRIMAPSGVGIADIGGAVLVRPTRPGDADLDGDIDGDDFFTIDANAGLVGGAVAYAVGDFDLNGRVDADDYWLIDSNYSKPAVSPAPLVAPHGSEQPGAIFSTAIATSHYRRLIEELAEL